MFLGEAIANAFQPGGPGMEMQQKMQAEMNAVAQKYFWITLAAGICRARDQRLYGRRRNRNFVNQTVGPIAFAPSPGDRHCRRADQSSDLRVYTARDGTDHARVHGENRRQFGEPRRRSDGKYDAGLCLRGHRDDGPVVTRQDRLDGMGPTLSESTCGESVF